MENIPKEILKMQVGAMVFGPHDNRLTYFTGMWLITGVRLTHSNHWKIKSTFDYHNK